ncbi:MAG: cytochrome C oxidase subunit IV family protein [Methylophagaceae bacterium]
MRNYYNVHTVWMLMVLLTLATYVMGQLAYSSILVLVMAAIKGSLIIRDFMELKGVSLLWRVIMYGWLWIICLTIAITYIISVEMVIT